MCQSSSLRKKITEQRLKGQFAYEFVLKSALSPGPWNIEEPCETCQVEMQKLFIFLRSDLLLIILYYISWPFVDLLLLLKKALLRILMIFNSYQTNKALRVRSY